MVTQTLDAFYLTHKWSIVYVVPLENTIQRTKVKAIINMSELDIIKVRRWCRVEWAGRGVVRGETCSTARRPADLQPLTALSVPGDSGRRTPPHARPLTPTLRVSSTSHFGLVSNCFVVSRKGV